LENATPTDASFAGAALALVFGFYFAEKLTRPSGAGCRRAAYCAGDFSQRVKVLGRTELVSSRFLYQMTDRIEILSVI